MTTKPIDLPPLQELSREESRAIFEEELQRRLGLDLETFLRRLREGAYQQAHDGDVDQILMLLPLIDCASDGGPDSR